MNTLPSSVSMSPETGFRPGEVALCIRRGNLSVLVPRSWVRGMRNLSPDAVTPLPRANRWVLGLVEEDGRPLPLLDPAVCVAAPRGAPSTAVLLAASGGDPFVLIGSDGPGRFVSLPHSAHLGEAILWMSPVQGGPEATWWLDAPRLAADLAV